MPPPGYFFLFHNSKPLHFDEQINIRRGTLLSYTVGRPVTSKVLFRKYLPLYHENHLKTKQYGNKGSEGLE